MLPLGIRRALVKYHIKPLDMTKNTKVFAKTFVGMICFYTRRDYMNTSAVSHIAQGYLKGGLSGRMT